METDDTHEIHAFLFVFLLLFLVKSGVAGRQTDNKPAVTQLLSVSVSKRQKKKLCVLKSQC